MKKFILLVMIIVGGIYSDILCMKLYIVPSDILLIQSALEKLKKEIHDPNTYQKFSSRTSERHIIDIRKEFERNIKMMTELVKQDNERQLPEIIRQKENSTIIKREIHQRIAHYK